MNAAKLPATPEKVSFQEFLDGLLQAKSRYHQAVTIRFSHSQDALAAIDQLQKLSTVERDPLEETRLTLFPENGTDIFQSVHRIIQDNHWEISELYTQKGHLDDVFREITNNKQQVMEHA